MPRFGCVTRAVCLVIRRARSRRRARMKASRSGRFKKNKAPEDRPTRCRMRSRIARAARYRRPRRRCADRASRQPPTLEQRELLDAFAAQLALFVNKERALEESRAAQISRQSQKLQKALFDSVSHELKTPLAAMSVALQSDDLRKNPTAPSCSRPCSG